MPTDDHSPHWQPNSYAAAAGAAVAAAAAAANVSRAKAEAEAAAAAASAKLEAEKALAEQEHAAAVEEEMAEVFASYVCASSAQGLARSHPGDIAESGLLSSVSLPALSYPADALAEAAQKGLLSSLQMEGILYACQAHLRILSTGRRMGFFLGDGAGVGKGRQIAGMILDNFARGRRKSVWLSLSGDLRVDAERDLRDIGCHVNVIDGCKGLDASRGKGLGAGRETQSGVVFTTYSTLISSSRGGGAGGGFAPQSRMQQIIDWCGGAAFDGALVFDEAHKAKNFKTDNEEASTKVSQCVIAIQEAMPLARVVYASATGVTDVSNLAYCDRLGLWGVGTPFGTFTAFKDSMDKRGIGALEMLAMELKSSGVYVSRGLSWKGAEFDTSICPLPAGAVKQYDAACAFWLDLRRELERAERLTGCTGKCSKEKCKDGVHYCSPMRPYWSALQRFFKELANAAKVPFIMDQARTALETGHSVVIGLQSTGEAGLEQAMEDLGKRPGDSVPSLISASYYMARSFLRTRFPTATRPKVIPVPSLEDVEAQLKKMQSAAQGRGETLQVNAQRAALLSNRSVLLRAAAEAAKSDAVPECEEARARLLVTLDALSLPPSPLDSLIDGLGGPGMVAEMTGRRARIVRRQGRNHLCYELRDDGSKAGAEASLNIKERKDFMAGKKHVAIISDAASTGVSLHAGVGSPAEHRRRLHITLELAWSADKTIQQLGRSHRSHQRSAPVYRLLVTNLGGERRFASVVAKRLMSLGALTKGDRRAASGGDFSCFDLDNKYGKAALRALMTATNTHASFAKGVTGEQLRCILADGGDTEEQGGDSLDDERVLKLIKESVDELSMDEERHHSNVGMFLNRIQSLPVSRQNLLFAYFTACFEIITAEARAAGTYDSGVADMRATHVRLDGMEEVGTDMNSGVRTVLTKVELDRGVDWDTAVAKLGEREGEDDGGEALPRGTGFYRSKHLDIKTRKHLYLLAVAKMSSSTHFVITRPSTGTSPFEMDRGELLHKYVPMGPENMEEVEAGWRECFRVTDNSNTGSRKLKVALLSGAVLPIWPALESTVRASGFSMTKAEQALKVYRVPLDDGRKAVGIRLPVGILGTLRTAIKTLQESRRVVEASTGTGCVTQPVAPVDDRSYKKATTPQNTILTFFKRKATDGDEGSESAPQPPKRHPKLNAASGPRQQRNFFAPKQIRQPLAPAVLPVPDVVEIVDVVDLVSDSD
jgi:hypothetical protein